MSESNPSTQSVSLANEARAANRRESFRVSGQGLAVRAWRMDPYDRLIDRPLPSRKIPLDVSNLGRGGLGGVAGHADRLNLGDRVRLELPCNVPDPVPADPILAKAHERLTTPDPDDVFLIEAKIVYLYPLPDGTARVGLRFADALTETLARRNENLIDKLLARLQRLAIRRSHEQAA